MASQITEFSHLYLHLRRLFILRKCSGPNTFSVALNKDVTIQLSLLLSLAQKHVSFIWRRRVICYLGACWLFLDSTYSGCPRRKPMSRNRPGGNSDALKDPTQLCPTHCHKGLTYFNKCIHTVLFHIPNIKSRRQFN